jgi:hypothetical protein
MLLKLSVGVLIIGSLITLGMILGETKEHLKSLSENAE